MAEAARVPVPSRRASAGPPRDREAAADRMVEVELNAARALADFARVALLERDARVGARRRRRIPVSEESREENHTLEDNHGGNVIESSTKIEQISEPLISSPSYLKGKSSIGVVKSRQNMSEVEKEAKRMRRILANRESARQTIRRRQALYEELTKKAADLALGIENMKKEKDLVMKEYTSLKNTNNQLKEQISKTVQTKTEESPSKVPCPQLSNSSTTSSEPLPIHRPFPAFVWPSVVQQIHPAGHRSSPQNSGVSLAPFYVLPCPWFYPSHLGAFQARYGHCAGQHVKEGPLHSRSHTNPNFSKEGLVKAEGNSLKTMHHTPADKHEGVVYSTTGSYYETMSVEVHRKLADALAAAEARKRRKELKKLKSINGGQVQLRR
ncbi:hypothetical protein QJS04_geneDACA008440 [Acorus gramineus]|uniref:BZIP domain-containing protein n=1 Tax=Acorus gramineus TaxID=55184 RepID=A0AAV9AIP8_ACOGR|nr:hypothetical protein QJS04_geneDACA008440 [Acorus gramineus]